MFSRLAELEGFGDVDTYYKNQNIAYNQYLPNIIPSAFGKPSVDITPALRSLNPQNDIKNASSLFTAIPMVSELANKKNEACVSAKGIEDIIDQGATQCGWFYTPPVNTSPIARFNKGFLAAGNSPAPLPNAPQANQYELVFSDQLPDGQKLADGKQRILTDICKSLRTCNDISKTPYNTLCGFCTDIGQGVPIDRDGAPLYTGPNNGCRPESLITQESKCPPPSPVTPKNGCTPGQPFNAACLRDALVQTKCDNGTLIQSLQGWTSSKDKNTATINNLRAVQKYNEAGQPTFDISKFLGTGISPSQTDAVQEISKVLSYTGTANRTLKGYASRELCESANGLDDYDFCSELNVGTPKPNTGWDLKCLQNAFQKAGGTPSGAKYPKNMSSEGTILFNGMRTWGEVTDWMNRAYSQARGQIVQGFSPSQFGGNTDPFVDIGAQTTANYKLQSNALNDMIGAPLKPVPDWTDTAVAGNWFMDPVPGARISTIAITDGANIYGTNIADGIWKKSSPQSTDWSLIPGALVQIDAKSPTQVVGVNRGGDIYQLMNGNWTRIGMRARWVSIGTDGTIVCVNLDSGSLWRYLGSVDSWENIPGRAVQISVANKNNMWCVNSNDDIFKWTGSNWTQIPGKLTRVAVSSKNRVAGVNRKGEIFVYSNEKSSWKLVPGWASNISISETYIAVTNPNSNIFYLKLSGSNP
jgi:hypothetical protein